MDQKVGNDLNERGAEIPIASGGSEQVQESLPAPRSLAELEKC